MKAVYVPQGTNYQAQPGEVVIETRDVPHLQNTSAQKATSVLGSTFGPHSFVKPENPNN